MVLYSKVLIIKNKLYALHKMTFEIKSNTIQTCWYISHEIEVEIFAHEARQRGGGQTSYSGVKVDHWSP